jgi:hypothetical protein
MTMCRYIVIDRILPDRTKVRMTRMQVRKEEVIQYLYTFYPHKRSVCWLKNGRDSRDISTDKIHVYIMLYDMQFPRRDKTLISLYVPLPSPLLVH